MEFKKQKARIQEIEKILKLQPTQKPGNQQDSIHEQKQTEMKEIKVVKLPYSYSALERFIDAETMKTHYNQHYKGYVKKLNIALDRVKDKEMNLEKIIKGISRYNTTIRNNAGGAYNHQLFWNMLSPKKQRPSGPVYDKIVKKFESYDNFKKEFTKKAKSQFGSGWVWLILTKSGDLKVMTTPNQDNPLMGVIKDGGHPLLGLDLWEHAYYLKYKSKRDDYINNFFSVINWKYVNRLFDEKNKTKINESRVAKEIISEGVSAGCSPKQVNAYRMIFNRNPQIKKKFMYTIMDILKEVYSEFWYDKNEYAEGQMSGVYDFEQPGRSVINKLNTNYSAFCILSNDISTALKHYGQPPLNFIGQSNAEQLNELSRMLKFMIEYRYRIFNPESATFKEIMSSLDKSNRFGDTREIKSVADMKKIFNTKKVFKVGELGGADDMLGGIDATVEDNGKIKTIQIKPFNNWEEKDGRIVVYGTGNVKPYSTDYMAFQTDKYGTYVFKTDGMKIIDGRFTFPKEGWVNPQ